MIFWQNNYLLISCQKATKSLDSLRLLFQMNYFADFAEMSCMSLYIVEIAFFLRVQLAQKKSKKFIHLSSLTNKYCTHHTSVPHKKALQKLNSMLLSCKNKSHGCLKITTYDNIQNHQANCPFNKFENCKKEHRLTVAKCHSPCPLEIDLEDEYKLKHDSNHLCGDWLKDASDNYEQKLLSLGEENTTLRREIQKIEREMKEDEKITNEQLTQLEHETKVFENQKAKEKVKYDERVNYYEQVSKSSMKVLKTESDNRATSFWKFLQKEIETLKSSMENASSDFLLRMSDLTDNYNEAMNEESKISIRNDEGISFLLSTIKGKNHNYSPGKSTNSKLYSSSERSIPQTKAFK